jgi:predicted flap endonuclease-1-like 5' DNA nuclease
MAQASKAERQQFVGDIASFVSDLAERVVEMQGGFRTSFAQMAETEQAKRSDFLAGIMENVSRLQKMVAEMRSEFSDDLEGARQAWSGSGRRARGGRKQPGRGRAEPAQQGPAAEAEPTATAGSPGENPVDEPAAVPGDADESPADDLTAIFGIGPGRMERLSEAGIHTYAQLARMTPDELRDLLGPAGKLVDVEKWISQAMDLAERF